MLRVPRKNKEQNIREKLFQKYSAKKKENEMEMKGTKY